MLFAFCVHSRFSILIELSGFSSNKRKVAIKKFYNLKFTIFAFAPATPFLFILLRRE